MSSILRLAAARTGTAAAEMAIVLPMILVLFFGSFDLGYYFLSEHVVQKAVRDAARYASRLPATNYNCAGPAVNATAEQQIRRVARFGNPTATTGTRLAGWTADTLTTVTLTCDSDATHTYVNKGIYTDFPDGVPVVTVSASVPYPTLFHLIGLGTMTLTLNAQSQAPVFGE
jgi:Flp pilus assembly protein TadG